MERNIRLQGWALRPHKIWAQLVWDPECPNSKNVTVVKCAFFIAVAKLVNWYVCVVNRKVHSSG